MERPKRWEIIVEAFLAGLMCFFAYRSISTFSDNSDILTIGLQILCVIVMLIRFLFDLRKYRRPSEIKLNLINTDASEACVFEPDTGKKNFFKPDQEKNDFHGYFIKTPRFFFALYSFGDKPRIFYKDMQYDLTSDLHIHIDSHNEKDKYRFNIDEYGLCIDYDYVDSAGSSPQIAREYTDLFYRIEQRYKTPNKLLF